MLSPRDDRFASFHWLTQCVEHVWLELWQFIEKQQAEVGERYFTGARP